MNHISFGQTISLYLLFTKRQLNFHLHENHLSRWTPYLGVPQVANVMCNTDKTTASLMHVQQLGPLTVILFLVVAPCDLIDRCQHFGEICYFRLLSWRRKQQVATKRSCLPNCTTSYFRRTVKTTNHIGKCYAAGPLFWASTQWREYMLFDTWQPVTTSCGTNFSFQKFYSLHKEYISVFFYGSQSKQTLNSWLLEWRRSVFNASYKLNLWIVCNTCKVS